MIEWKTAAQLVEELQKDAALVQRQQAQQQERLRGVDHLQEVLAPLRRELVAAGVEAAPFAELPMVDAAVPVLLTWLPLVQVPSAKKAIVRALSVPSARPDVVRALLAEFVAVVDDPVGVKWAIANALEVVAGDEVFEELAALASDPRHGEAREMLVVALGTLQNARAPEVLLQLLNDREVAGHAVVALGKLRSLSARSRSALAPFLRDSRAWVRRAARRAIDRARVLNEEMRAFADEQAI